MSNISIFAKLAFRGKKHLMRVSSIIRANQVAEHLGAKLNPESGYENDICIYIKPHVKKHEDLNFEGKPYLDIVDGHNLGHLALKHPEVPIIVCSQENYEIMSSAIPNEIVLIPQHHCNFERFKRTRKEITVLGALGAASDIPYFPKDLEKELAKRGMVLSKYSGFTKRQDVIDFYLKTDIQIVWRPYKMILRNPLKLVNASAFGVPTIALNESNFREMGDCYLPVKDFKEFLVQLDRLRIPSVYAKYSERCLRKSEEYHIEKIGELYKKLKGDEKA